MPLTGSLGPSVPCRDLTGAKEGPDLDCTKPTAHVRKGGGSGKGAVGKEGCTLGSFDCMTGCSLLSTAGGDLGTDSWETPVSCQFQGSRKEYVIADQHAPHL